MKNQSGLHVQRFQLIKKIKMYKIIIKLYGIQINNNLLIYSKISYSKLSIKSAKNIKKSVQEITLKSIKSVNKLKIEKIKKETP